MEEDTSLMCRAREGDVEAFTRLVERHRKRVEGFLYRLFWDRGKAEDGAQEVFLRLWLARGRYQPTGRFTTFLYQVARNYWLDEARKSRVRPAEVALPEDDGLPGSTRLPAGPASLEPHTHLFQRYRQRQIREAIAALPATHRIVFVLAHLEDRKLTEIADILQIPVGTVKSRLHAAVRALRRRLGAEWEERES